MKRNSITSVAASAITETIRSVTEHPDAQKLAYLAAILLCAVVFAIKSRGATNKRLWPPQKTPFQHVEPLKDFDFTKVEPLPYRPFQNKRHVAIGAKKLDVAEWIRMDKGYLKRLAERDEIMKGSRPEVIGTGVQVNPAIEELYEMLVHFLPRRFPTMFEVNDHFFRNKVTGKTYSVDIPKLGHAEMLRNLGENVEEDFYFMCPDKDDELRLEGWLACFPGGFSTTSRKGLSMREIHQPVPGYERRIAAGADRHLSQLRGGELIERYNWSLQTDGQGLFRLDGNNFYPEQGQIVPDQEDDVNIDECFLRVEHQTLIRLARSRAVVFCVRSYMTSLHDIKKEGNGVLLAEAFESMPHKLRDYKKVPFWQSTVYKFLKS